VKIRKNKTIKKILYELDKLVLLDNVGGQTSRRHAAAGVIF